MGEVIAATVHRKPYNSSTSEFLFVGGYADGRRISVDDTLPCVRIPEEIKPNLTNNINYTKVRTHDYRKTRLIDEGHIVHEVFVLHNCRNLIERLIIGYKNPDA